jgi:hypothetical protein
MIELIYSPKWFYGKDIIIDIVSIFVLSLIAYFSIRYYKINSKNKNYLFFASSFGAMALSFLFKIITNFTLYSKAVQTKQIGFVTFTYSAIQSSDLLFFIGFLVHRILMLIGLFILYSIYSKTKKANIILILYLILISMYFSRSAYYVFHLTALLLLVMVTLQYWNNYKKVNHDTNKWLFYSFSLITLSQVVFIFIGINTLFYVAAEVIQLLGYMALLITFIKVLKDGKEKRAKRYNT